ncbi:MAG: iron transporter [Lachnospiraceae bacterium]|nr:iron transporter [Lachnospiraceae bacterium]
MKKLLLVLSMTAALSAAVGCSTNETTETVVPAPEEEIVEEVVEETEETEEVETEETEPSDETVCELEDGVYTATFTTDSSMFKVNETLDDKGILTVKDGEMTIHISLQSQKILNLYSGLAEDAQAEGAVLLEPTLDEVTYPDGLTEEVNGFDVPVPYLNKEFDLALVGTKGTWYDHKVSVSDPVPYEEGDDTKEETTDAKPIEDGEYTIDVVLEGGTGKASVTSPCNIKVENGSITATIEWSSPNYDYMLVGDEKYLPVNTEGNSVFEIPVKSLTEPVDVIGDTVAMSTPHEIEYQLIFDIETLK